MTIRINYLKLMRMDWIITSVLKMAEMMTGSKMRLRIMIAGPEYKDKIAVKIFNGHNKIIKIN